jgi:hypothetical protein
VKLSAFFFGFLEPESIEYRGTEIPGKPEKVFVGLCVFLFLESIGDAGKVVFWGAMMLMNSPPLDGWPKVGVVAPGSEGVPPSTTIKSLSLSRFFLPQAGERGGSWDFCTPSPPLAEEKGGRGEGV